MGLLDEFTEDLASLVRESTRLADHMLAEGLLCDGDVAIEKEQRVLELLQKMVENRTRQISFLKQADEAAQDEAAADNKEEAIGALSCVCSSSIMCRCRRSGTLIVHWQWAMRRNACVCINDGLNRWMMSNLTLTLTLSFSRSRT